MATIRSNNNILTVSVNSHIFIFDISANDRSIKFQNVIDVAQFCKHISNSGDGDNDEENDSVKQPSSIQILDSDFSLAGDLFSVVTSSKHLILFAVNEKWKLLGEVRQLPKAPTIVHFDQSNNIVIGDRSGCVRRVIRTGDVDVVEDLLGHVSMLLDFCLSLNGKRILTADRDEKLRISRYPQSFVIDNFCLGHTSFISSVVMLDENIAATAGGDSTIRLWNIGNGECNFCLEKVCQSAIRKLCVGRLNDVIRLAVLPEGSTFFKVFEYNKLSCVLESEIEHKAEEETVLFDIAFNPNVKHWLCLGRRGIYCCGFMNGPLKRSVNHNKIIEKLAQCNDAFPMTQLYKVVAYDNIKTYTERKKEKLLRKRKIIEQSDE